MMSCKEDTMPRNAPTYKNISKKIMNDKRQVPKYTLDNMNHVEHGTVSSLKGDVAELKASAWLMEQGFYVFTNFSKSGGIDLIAVREELGNCVIYPIDVKTMTRYRKKKNTSYDTEQYCYYSFYRTPVQKEMNVRLLYYYSHSGKFMFQDEEEKLLPKGVAGKGVHRFAFDVNE